GPHLGCDNGPARRRTHAARRLGPEHGIQPRWSVHLDLLRRRDGPALGRDDGAADRRAGGPPRARPPPRRPPPPPGPPCRPPRAPLPIDVPLGGEGKPFAITFSSDARTALVGRDNHTAQLWDLAQGRPIGPQFLGHEGAVFAVALRRDGLFAATGSQDRSVRL